MYQRMASIYLYMYINEHGYVVVAVCFAAIILDTVGQKLQYRLKYFSQTMHSCQRISVAFFRRFGIEVKDFGSSWRDGMAFNAMIHNIRPELVDMATLPSQPPRVNLEHAFNTAENHLGIPRLLDPEGRTGHFTVTMMIM